MKASVELASSIAWHGRNLHYVKTLPPLAEYLTPAKPKPTHDGARDVKRMFDRMIEKQRQGE